MRIVLLGPRAIADVTPAPLLHRDYIRAITSSTWDYFHLKGNQGSDPSVIYYPSERFRLLREWGYLRVVCQGSNRIAQVHKAMRCWDSVVAVGSPTTRTMTIATFQRISLGLLSHLIRYPDECFLRMTGWVRLTSYCPQFRMMQP